MSLENPSQRRGYLKEPFMLFHLKDCQNEQFAEHYHDFSKIIIFISGTVTYLVEGNSYRLQPWDILLITSRDLHRPLINTDKLYERYVIWFKPEFLQAHSTPDCQLLSCFETASAQRQSLIRPSSETVNDLKYLLNELKTAATGTAFGDGLAKNAFFLLLIISLNRLYRQAGPVKGSGDVGFDRTVTQVIEFIDQNLAADLLIEDLAKRFYLSKYSLMHKFKKQTGYSIHHFILEKRLIAAHELIKQGCPYMEASSRCGFADYSSFVRAFSNYFGLSPRKYYGSKAETVPVKTVSAGPHI